MTLPLQHEVHRENERLIKALKYLIGKCHTAAKQIDAETKLPMTANTMKRVADHAVLLEAAAICAETVFKEKS